MKPDGIELCSTGSPQSAYVHQLKQLVSKRPAVVVRSGMKRMRILPRVCVGIVHLDVVVVVGVIVPVSVSVAIPPPGVDDLPISVAVIIVVEVIVVIVKPWNI